MLGRAGAIDHSPPATRRLLARTPEHAAWQSRLPDEDATLWDWLQKQDAETLTGLLAYCVACTVKPMRGAASDRLATALALDMAQWWQPTVTGYLGRVSKTLILEAVTEGNGKTAAENLAALKKGDMAERAAELLSGSGLVPAMLRAA